MAVTIELWVDGKLVDGTERWWDEVELWLARDNARLHYPLLASIDPYGDRVIPQQRLPDLMDEVERAALSAPSSVATLARKLAALCDAGIRARSAELRFNGD